MHHGTHDDMSSDGDTIGSADALGELDVIITRVADGTLTSRITDR